METMGRRTMAKLAQIAAFSAALFACACTTTRGYDGPELPESEVSRVYFYANKGVDLTETAIDGRSRGFFDMSIDILPGAHNVWLTYAVKDESCDYYGCTTRTYSGKCETTLRTAAGKKYAVRVNGYGEVVSISAEEDDEGAAYAGSGSCTATDYDYSYTPNPPPKRKR